MKNKPSQLLVQNDQPANLASADSKVVEKTSGMPVLIVPDCDSSNELADFCDTLLTTLAAAPQFLHLRFIGPHKMVPDSALLIYELLATKRNRVTVITDAWSPILGPGLLVWLAGEVRRMRPTTHFQFLPLHGVMRRNKSRRPQWEDDFEAMADASEPEVYPVVTDYKKVLELMNQYLPVDEFAGKAITPEMLGELGLLENSPLDAMLQKCLAKEVPAKAPQPTGPCPLSQLPPTALQQVLRFGFVAKEYIELLTRKSASLGCSNDAQARQQQILWQRQISQLRNLDQSLDGEFYLLVKTPDSRPKRQKQLSSGVEKKKARLGQMLVEFGFGSETLKASLAVAKRVEEMIKQASAKGDHQKLEDLRIFVRMPLAEFEAICQNLTAPRNRMTF